MAHIQDRWYKTIHHPDGGTERVRTALYGKGDRYRLRCIDPEGKEKSESFPDKQKRLADARLVEIESDKMRGMYIDPAAGRMTFQRYAEGWLAAATSDEATQDRIEREMRLHVFPTIGRLPLAQAAQTSTIRSWSRHIQDKGLSVGYRRILFNDVSMIFNAAIDDKKIVANPFAAKTIRPPRAEEAKVVPWTVEERTAVRNAMRDRYRITVDLGAGCGMRQGEIFALSPDDLDPSRPILQVHRQIKLVRHRLFFALPKGGKVREVPLPDSVAARLRAHAATYPPTPVTLPWGSSTGDPQTVTLFLYTVDYGPVTRSAFNSTIWKPALRAAGVPATARNGIHILRHTYASMLLNAGESVKALAVYLGHANPGFTLRIYTHLLPTSEDRTRRAIDEAFRDDLGRPDGLETA